MHTCTILQRKLLLGVYPTEVKTDAYTNTCTERFIPTLFLIAPNWKQLKSLSTEEEINKLCYIHTMEFYLEINGNVIPILEMAGINLKISVKKETTKYDTIYMIFWKRQNHGDRNQING